MYSGRNGLGVTFGALHCRLRDLYIKRIEAEIFEELRNIFLEENGEDKMVRETNNEQAIDCVGEKRALLNNILHRNWIGHIQRKKKAFFMMPLNDIRRK